MEKLIKKLINKLKNRKNISWVNFLIFILLVTGVFFLFYRFPLKTDLTKTRAYTLSEASKSLVRDLKDPIRIKIFVSDNLPPPFNDLELALKDILAEYDDVGKSQFSYTFYNINEKENSSSDEVRANLELASQYGIAAQQVQTFDKDEVKLVRVYFGLVLEYGNAIEKIPFFANNGSLEYQLTELISRMTKKINKIISLKENIKINLYLNDEFKLNSFHFGIKDLDKVEPKLTKILAEVKKDNFNKVDFKTVKKITDSEKNFLNSQPVKTYPWNKFNIPGVGESPAGVGYAVLSISLGDKIQTIELLDQQVTLQLTSQGLRQVTVFKLINLEGNLKEIINSHIESILQVNEKIAYLKDKGTVVLSPSPLARFQPNQPKPEAGNFFNFLSKNYTVEEITLEELDDKYNSLIIAGASGGFSEAELFKIDQFLMKGKSLILLQDSYQNQVFDTRIPPQLIEITNGLNNLINHYGLEVGKSIVLDKESYISRQPSRNGSVSEAKIYFAPIIKNINNDFKVLENVKEFIALQHSPVNLLEDSFIKQADLKATLLFSSSPQSWLMKDNINFNPQAIVPPLNPNEYSSENLAYILEGEFNSYFSDKLIPVSKEAKEKSKTNKIVASTSTTANLDEEKVSGVIKKSKSAKLLVIGSSQDIKDNIFGQGLLNPNSIYFMNLIDYVNDKEDWGVMRGKVQYSSPLEKFDPNAGVFKRIFTNRSLIKSFNMVGLPLMVGVLGLLAFLLKKKRRKLLAKKYNQ